MNCKKRCCRIVSKHVAGTQDKVIHWTVLRIRNAARLKTHEEVDRWTWMRHVKMWRMRWTVMFHLSTV